MATWVRPRAVDSTINCNVGARQGSMAAAVSEKIDGADTFDGSDDYVNCSSDSSLDFDNQKQYTFSAWVKTVDATSYTPVITKVDDATGGFNFQIVGHKVQLVDDGGGDSVEGSTTLNDDEWYHVVAVYNTASDVRVYVNGTLDGGPGAISPNSETTGNLTIGYMNTQIDGESWFEGTIDEVRISNIVRNSSWIGTCYNNTNDTSNFTTFGPQKTKNVAPVLSSPSPSDEATGQELNPTLSITVNDTNVDSMDVTFRTNASGTWSDIGSNNSVSNGTYSQTPSNMNSYNTTYYWSVNCTDGTAWTNSTYHFTTMAIHTYVVNDVDAQGYYAIGDSSWQAFSDPGETEFSVDNYNAIDEDDANDVMTQTGVPPDYPYHRFNFTISESISSIINITITWKGCVEQDGPSGQSLCVYESGSWVEKDNGTSISKETLSVTYTDNFNSIISSGILQVGATPLEDITDGALYSYYAEVNVTYTP